MNAIRFRTGHQWLVWRGTGWDGCEQWSHNWTRYNVTRGRR